MKRSNPERGELFPVCDFNAAFRAKKGGVVFVVSVGSVGSSVVFVVSVGFVNLQDVMNFLNKWTTKYK